MAKGYWIAHNPVKDAEVYGAYKIAAAPALRAYGAQFLVRAGRSKTLEGTPHPRTIVIEFPSYKLLRFAIIMLNISLQRKFAYL